ncbi:MAG: BamA/TamA family outer membrane protein, partial [Deltaproteobacteria bacterium]|nr:BamA/TamA family outer membrane protein [Deltaproteobacteria bacterium]
IAGLSVSDPYNEYRLRESSGGLAAFYRSHGYMFVEAGFDKSFSSDMERARVVFTIREGPQVRAGRIRIEGAEMTSKRLIRERLVIEPGDLVTPNKIEESQQRLMELGILDSATVQMISPDAAAEIKNLKVQVSEGNPQYLELRAGMATVEGFRGGFEYGYRNLAGWAINARLRARANYRLFFLGNESPVISAFEEYYNDLDLDKQIEHHVLVGVGQPHLPGTKGLLGWGIDGIMERLNEPAFSAKHWTGFVRLNTTHALGLKFRRAFTAELRTGLELSTLNVLALKSLLGEGEDSDDRIINPVYTPYLRLPDGKSLFWVTGLKFALDFRDHPFNPTKGILVSLGGDLVRSLSGFKPEYRDSETGDTIDTDALSGDELAEGLESEQILKVYKLSKLIRAQATISGYIPFGDTEMVLALSTTVGYIFHLTDDSVTWANRYFYAGGIDTLRGFPEESLVPEDIYQDWKSTLQDSSQAAGDLLKSSGGEAMFIARAEFRYPLAKGFYGAFFSEVGNLWREQNKINFVDLSPFRVHLRPVAGGGIRYLTPLGSLSFDLGVNLFRRPHESLFAWYLSIGTAF